MYFFKLPKHKVFEYQPLYYDPEKERREKRRKELGLTGADEPEEVKAGTGDLLRSGAMRARHEGFIQDREDDTRRATVRRITIFVVLAVVVYSLIIGKLDMFVNFFFSK